jgi:hypothetical protein
MNRKKLVVAMAGGASALALIGVGAGASFTDAIAASQSVTAGTMNVGIVQASGAKTYALPLAGPEASTFNTGANPVTIQNYGNIAVNAFTVSASDVNDGAANSLALKGELYVKITSYNAEDLQGGSNVVYDGTLTGLETSPLTVTGPIDPGHKDQMEVQFYAGQGSAPSLTDDAQGGSITPTIKVSYSG